MDRPVTTLFMLSSVDGKISTGATDALDADRDLPKIPGVREGLRQYYEIEQTTDLWSFNTGRVFAKLGLNEQAPPAKTPVSFVLLDNHHLTARGAEPLRAREGGRGRHLEPRAPRLSDGRGQPSYHLSGASGPPGRAAPAAHKTGDQRGPGFHVPRRKKLIKRRRYENGL